MPPLWEVRPTEFPLAGEVLDRATGVIVHSRYVEMLAREHGYDGPLWRIPHPAWPAPDVEPAPIEGAPLIGSLRPPEREQADPAAAPRVRRAARAPARRAPPARRRGGAGLRPRGPARAARPRRRGRDPRALRRGGAAVGADGRLRRLRPPARTDDGGDLGLRDPHALARQAARRQRPRLVRRAAGRRRAEGAGRTTTRRRRSPRRSSGSPSPASLRGWARPHASTSAREHDLDRVAGQYVAALEQAAGSAAVEAKIGLARGRGGCRDGRRAEARRAAARGARAAERERASRASSGVRPQRAASDPTLPGGLPASTSSR